VRGGLLRLPAPDAVEPGRGRLAPSAHQRRRTRPAPGRRGRRQAGRDRDGRPARRPGPVDAPAAGPAAHGHRAAWEGLTEAEVADQLGCSVGNVKSAASRGLARFRELGGAENQLTTSGTARIFWGNLQGAAFAYWTYRGRQYRTASYASSGQPTGEERVGDRGSAADYHLGQLPGQDMVAPDGHAPAAGRVHPGILVRGCHSSGRRGRRIKLRKDPRRTELRPVRDRGYRMGRWRASAQAQADSGIVVRDRAAAHDGGALVDASAYLPVRDVVTVGSHGTIQDDFQWLRPTPANLAETRCAHPGWVHPGATSRSRWPAGQAALSFQPSCS
jgi:hypothetical protein